jgi:hypothetical protein
MLEYFKGVGEILGFNSNEHKNMVLCVMTPCTIVGGYGHFISPTCWI